ncbi:hypothetical protein ACKKBF_B19915 [Auxenochlorella protothecoides x Auxenochlorella symbiontica]
MNILLSIGALLAASALLAVLIAIGWFSIWKVALCKLQVFQEMLGLRKPAKPSRREMQSEIQAIKEQHMGDVPVSMQRRSRRVI